MRRMYKALSERIVNLETSISPKIKRVFILKRGEKIEDYPKQDNSDHQRVFIVRRSEMRYNK